MPSASRPSLTHLTVLAIGELYSLDEHLRAPPPVVELAPARRQRADVGGAEFLLEEPVRRPRREGEHAPQAQGAAARLAFAQQPDAVAGFAVLRGDGEAGELAAALVGVGIQRRAADDDAIVVDDE